jgi:hypothetical protein
MRIALSLVLVGCVTSSDPLDSHTGTGAGTGTGTETGAPDAPPNSVIASGSYDLHSSIDLTVEALLPQPAADLVVTLRDFSANPAHTLITLAEDAGVPAVSELRAVLPDALESRLEGWINTEIAKVTIDGVPVTVVAAEIAALAETALTQFSIDSTLAVSIDTATHTLSRLDFTPAGIDASFALEGLPSEIISSTATISSSADTLTIGDHVFAIRYGEYAWRAVDQTFVTQHGAGIRATLGTAIHCPGIAQVVANKCVLGVCVGHVSELTELCERGLDEVVERAHARIAAIKLDAVHFASGTAALVDIDHDAIADRLVDGQWDAEINAGQGLRHIPATFVATVSAGVE